MLCSSLCIVLLCIFSHAFFIALKISNFYKLFKMRTMHVIFYEEFPFE